MVASAISQLTREERVQVFGIDCPDELIWRDWKPGHEQVKDLTLQNVSLVTQKLRVNLPASQEFDMPYPTTFKLSPGMSKKIPIAFRPVKYSENGYLDTIKISTKGGDFVIIVHAVVKESAVRIPPFLDFGMCPVPVCETTTFQIYNAGNYDVDYVWDANVPPFSVSPSRGRLLVGKFARCKLSFTPKAANVYDAVILLKATGGDSGAPKMYQMQLAGIGKVPYLQLLPSCPSTLHFGQVLQNNVRTLSVCVQNVTPVRAPFCVDIQDVTPGDPAPRAAQPFSMSPAKGIVEPNGTTELTFKFQSSTVGETACQRFDIISGGVTSLSLTCSGHCKSKRLHLSTRSVNFGEVEVGARCSYVIKLTNDEDEGIQFFFMNQGGFLTLDKDHGVVPSKSFVCITAYFAPLLPLNYYATLYCICRGSDTPQPVHILGTAYSVKQRPCYLRQVHVDNYRRRFQKPNEEVSFLDFSGRAWDQINVSPSVIDFSKDPSARVTLTVTNTTAHKVTCTWMVAGESFHHDTTSPACTVNVYPLQSDIRPRGSAEFHVSFKTLRIYAYEGLLLQAIVYEKINRNFRLVEADKLVPPWCVNVQIIGHSMNSMNHAPQFSISDDVIRFKSVVSDGRSFHVVNITNHGDNSLVFELLSPTDSPFSIVGPYCGLIKPHHFHNIVVEFHPREAKNKTPYRAQIPVIFNFDREHARIINVFGRCWDPSLHIEDVDFPLTCLGTSSSLVCDLKNTSEICVKYTLSVPKKFVNVFTLQQPTGQLLPLQKSKVMATFTPAQEGFSGTVLSVELESSSTKRDIAVQLVGYSKMPVLRVDPGEIDFGPIEAFMTASCNICILNTSDMGVMWRAEWISHGSAQHSALSFEYTEGQIAARCTQTLTISLRPLSRGIYHYEVKIIPVLETACIPLHIRGEVSTPYVQIVDVRTESANPQPVSLLWTFCRVDELNELYSGEVAATDRDYQKAVGLDDKRSLQKKLSNFQFSLGTAALGSPPCVLYIALTNPGKLPLSFSFETPKSFDLKKKPSWSDDKMIQGEEHYHWVEEHGIFNISPMESTIEPSSFLHLRLAYNHYSVGDHVLPVVLNILNGKSILLYLKGCTLPPDLGKLSIRSATIKLQPVPIGHRGVVQVIELLNSGAICAPWRVNMETIEALNRDNYDFNVLSVHPLSGVLDPNNSCFLHLACVPLEAKTYKCMLQVEMIDKNEEPIEDLNFDLEYDAYDPRDGEPDSLDLFPPLLPIQTYAPVPGCGCALSLEELHFGRDIKIPSVVERITILVNYTDEYNLDFFWRSKDVAQGLTIEPAVGTLAPGSHLVVVFRLETQVPIDISAEVTCVIDWAPTNMEAPRPAGNTTMETEEILAFHKDHVHEPAHSSNPLLWRRHVSVLNRLTISRFRALMSTAAGQKFLSANLHTNAFVSSNLPLQTATHENKVQARAPTTTPLIVRLLARAPAWEPPPATRKAPLECSPHPGEDNPYICFQTATQTSESYPMETPFELMEKAMCETATNMVNSADFEANLDSLVRQQTPYFAQFDVSGIPRSDEVHTRRQDILAAKQVQAGGSDKKNADYVQDGPSEDVRPAWSSSVLMDFQISPRRASESSEDEEYVAPVSPAPVLHKPLHPDEIWDQLVKNAGEIDLVDFQSVAGEALSSMVIQSVGHIVSGKNNWR